MTQKLGIIMDPIHAINIKHDSSFALLLEAQRRGYSLFYMEQRDLFLRDGVACARMRSLKVYDDAKHWFDFGVEKIAPLRELNVILMRKDPPVDMEYIYTTHMLSLCEKEGVLVVNKPQSLRDFNEKLFISKFPQCCVPTLVTHQTEQVREFLKEYKDIICKPIDAMGGKGVFRLQANDANVNVVLETLTQNGTGPMMAQRYIPEIKQGDKRIFLIDGKPLPYAFARFAQGNDIRANIAAGGRGEGAELSKRDYWICEQIGGFLREHGLLFVGIDVIGDYLTEINITSPTCIRELDAIYSLNISAQILDVIEVRL